MNILEEQGLVVRKRHIVSLTLEAVVQLALADIFLICIEVPVLTQQYCATIKKNKGD